MSKERIVISSLSGIAEDSADILEEGVEHTSVVVVAEDSGTVTVELPDGTQAVVHNALDDDESEMEGVAFQLEDGRIGYIYGDTLLQAVADSETVVDPLSIKDEPQETQQPLFLHSANGKLICNYPNCEKSYSSINHLKTHQRWHTGTRPHECDVCKKSFTTGYALKSHIRIHTGEKPYQCPEEQCGKSFKTSGDLQKHVRTHTGERPFKCQMCGKSFTTSNIRKVHMRVHTGEKPYECVYEGCGRKFASATNYRNHCRIHTGEKPYVCSVGNCGKRFTEYSSLYKHHMVHNQQKRYCCVHCGRFYRQLSTLAVHRKTVHNITDNEDGQFIWLAQDIQVGVIEEDRVESQESSNTFQPECSSSVTKTVRIATDLDIGKKENQMLQGTILNSHFLEDGVEVSNVDLSGETIIQDDQGTALTSLELDDSGNGSILVLTDPSQLAALQQLAVAGSSVESSGEDVKVISLDDFTTVSESSIPKGMKEASVLKHDNKIIFVREVDQKIEGDVC